MSYQSNTFVKVPFAPECVWRKISSSAAAETDNKIRPGVASTSVNGLQYCLSYQMVLL
jgi:hypothetical protein